MPKASRLLRSDADPLLFCAHGHIRDRWSSTKLRPVPFLVCSTCIRRASRERVRQKRGTGVVLFTGDERPSELDRFIGHVEFASSGLLAMDGL